MMSTTQNRSQQNRSQATNQQQNQQHKAESMVSEAVSVSEDCVRNNPVTSTLVAFGAGTALGLLVAYAISQREEERRSYFSQLGRQMSNALGHTIPDSFMRR